MKFNYKARTKEGKIEKGTIDAFSKEAATLLLQKYNIFVTSLEEQWLKESFLERLRFQRKVSRKNLVIFFRQLSIMLESRVPVVQALLSLSFQTHKKSFKEVILKISSLVEQGVPLSEALATYPKIFNDFYVNLVKSGEVSGKISETFSYLSDYLEREDDIIVQIKQAMVYPIFVLCVMFLVIIIIIVEVVPRISDLVKEVDSKPPLSTLIMLNFYKFLENYWLILTAGLFLLVILMFYYFNTKIGRKNYDKISLKMPFMAGFLKKVFLIRLCGNISTLLVAGISINKALKITEDTINNIVYKGITAQIEKEVSEGGRISSAMLKNQDYFPPFVVQMVRVGEETGKLDKTLMGVVNFYQKEIKRAIDLFSRLLEPVMIIFLGAIVLMLAISVLSPLYSLLGTI